MDTILSLILTGGEPYLRHDLDQIVRIFYENAKIPIITIPSNGWYLKKMDKQIRNMMEWCPNLTLNQQISIDGIGADHNAIRMEQQVVGSDNSFADVIQKIDISNLTFGENILLKFDNDSKMILGKNVALEEIDFRIEDENNTLLNLNNRNWSFTFVLETY